MSCSHAESFSGNGQHASYMEIAENMLKQYVQHPKGYMNQQIDDVRQRKLNKRHNKNISSVYKKNPRKFWCDNRLMSNLSPVIIKYDIFIFSIRSGSVKCESEFSRMGWMISARRSSITSSNANKRLTMGNLLPRKRRLEKEIKVRKIKKQKLFHLQQE